MKSCDNCQGTGAIRMVGNAPIFCDECKGTGWEGGQNPDELVPVNQSAAVMKPDQREWTLEDVTTINKLIDYHKDILCDLDALDPEMARAEEGRGGKTRLVLKHWDITTTYPNLKHIGLALRALLVQQEIKARRQLLELGVRMPMPLEKFHPYYYENESFWTLEHLAQMLGRPFDEK